MLLFLNPDDQTSVLPSNWVLLRARSGFDQQVHYRLQGAVRSWPYLLFLPEPFTMLTCSWLFSNMVEEINLGQLRTTPASGQNETCTVNSWPPNLKDNTLITQPSCLWKIFLSYNVVTWLYYFWYGSSPFVHVLYVIIVLSSHFLFTSPSSRHTLCFFGLRRSWDRNVWPCLILLVGKEC